MSGNVVISRRRTLAQAYKNFIGALNTAGRIYAPARSWCRWTYETFEENPYHPTVAAKVIGLAFLSMAAAWEEFIEESFVRYLAGAASPSGYMPSLRLSQCASIDRGKQVITGSLRAEQGYRSLRWNDYRWVLATAQVFFRDAEPFSLVPEDFRMRLSEAQVLRNRVAHNSTQARRKFKTLANSYLKQQANAALPRGFSPGELLTMENPGVFNAEWVEQQHFTWGDLFECYNAMYFELGAIIVRQQ